MSNTILSLPDRQTATMPKRHNLNAEDGLSSRLFTLTQNFIEIPIVDHEAYDYGWLAYKTAREVTTVG